MWLVSLVFAVFSPFQVVKLHVYKGYNVRNIDALAFIHRWMVTVL